MILTREMRDKYLQNPMRCPFCQSKEIEAAKPEANGDDITVPVVCTSCREEWEDIYELRTILYDDNDESEEKPEPVPFIAGYA